MSSNRGGGGGGQGAAKSPDGRGRGGGGGGYSSVGYVYFLRLLIFQNHLLNYQ